MKIRAALRESWDSQKARYDELSRLVDALFRLECAARRWHYEARVKELDSFAMKVETGRVSALEGLEDFFGCTLVVQNSSQIPDAISYIESVCDVAYRRPPVDTETPHRSSNFAFDDLRLYVRLKPPAGARPSPADGLLFEVQLKTFLMHAWSIATHDLLYKTDQLSWARERIAFQVRAMLEHAEITIQQADQLSAATQLAREDRETTDLKVIMAALDLWPADQLPRDKRRLAQNVRGMLRAMKIEGTSYAAWLTDAVAAGPLPLDVGPYQHAVQMVLQHELARFRRFTEQRAGRTKVVLYEADRPDWLAVDNVNVLLVSAD